MIKKDLSELPVSVDAGVAPSRTNVVAEKLAEVWFQRYLDAGNADKARAIPELPYRASYASKRCDRQLFYALSDTPESEPLTIASAWTMGLGTMVHDALQGVMESMFPDSECEPDVDLRAVGIPGSGHADVVLRAEDTLVEVKTTGGFSFKMMATTFKGAPQGPRFSYVLQAAMMAQALGLSKFVIALLSLEPVSPQLAETYSGSEAGRFAAEWHFETEQFANVVADEARRVKLVLTYVSEGVLPPRQLHDPEFPVGAVVQAPMAARAPWVVAGPDGIVKDTGTYWGCAYCPWRSKCHDDGAS